MTITAERARELLHYDPDLGWLMWRQDRGPHIKAGDVAGCPTHSGHIRIKVDGRLVMAHRLAWLIMTGEHPRQQIGHRNGQPADNSWPNLRDVPQSVNMWNQRRAHRNNAASGLLGVRRSTKPWGKPWRAVIARNGQRRHLGMFDTPEQAHAAYLDAKRTIHHEANQ